MGEMGRETKRRGYETGNIELGLWGKMCSRATTKRKKVVRRIKGERERHPTRSNEQSRNSAFPTARFLQSSKPKNTYIRASLALRISPDPFFLPLIFHSLYIFAMCLFLFWSSLVLIKCRNSSSSSCDFAFGVLQERGFNIGFEAEFRILFSPSLSSGFSSSSSSAEAVATLSHWDGSRSRKRLVACTTKQQRSFCYFRSS